MQVVNAGEKAAHDAAMTAYTALHDAWVAQDPSTRGDEPVAPAPLQQYEATQVSEPTQIETHDGPAGVMPGNYILQANRTFSVTAADLANPNLWLPA